MTLRNARIPLRSDFMDYYSAIKMKDIMPFAATWIELQIILLSEVNQKEKDKYML